MKFQIISVIGASMMMLGACATQPQPSWTAIGYLSPSKTSGETIGNYPSEAECRAAVEAWMSRQVVGNPVSGDCKPSE